MLTLSPNPYPKPSPDQTVTYPNPNHNPKTMRYSWITDYEMDFPFFVETN